MDTPICDFVARYADATPLRLHMPGHKGISLLGVEHLDITEIDGADSLFEANGIIRKSEENASRLFGCHTLYSTEGSSLCIRAMLYLCMIYATQQGKTPLIAAARNVHSTFIRAAAMLDFEIHWLYSENVSSYLSCVIEPQSLDNWLSNTAAKPVALYLTSPDYLGNVSDIKKLSNICHKHGVLLIVDNAHGAYLRFLPRSEHPIDLGADLCCDSAHKTLPVLTGGAYLHISDHAPAMFSQLAKQALAMFASTSPSYLILQSLDAANNLLSNGYSEKLSSFLSSAVKLKSELMTQGYRFIGNELLKYTIDCKDYGYTGQELAQHLKTQGITVEFADPDYLVLMLTPAVEAEGLSRLRTALMKLPHRSPLSSIAPSLRPGVQRMTPRQAAFSCCETIPVAECLGRILASPSIGCPPAVPIVVCGEEIDEAAIACFSYYGIKNCCVTIP